MTTAQDGGSHVGCHADVIRLADRLCSGRRTCHIQIPEHTFDEVSTCPAGLAVYLEVSYDCRPGEQSLVWRFGVVVVRWVPDFERVYHFGTCFQAKVSK